MNSCVICKKKRKPLEDLLDRLEEHRKSIVSLLDEKRKGFLEVVRNQFEEVREQLSHREFETMNEINAIFEKEVNRLDLTIGEKSIYSAEKEDK